MKHCNCINFVKSKYFINSFKILSNTLYFISMIVRETMQTSNYPIFQVCFTTLGLGGPLILTLLTAIVDQMKLFQTLPGVGNNGSCFLSITGAKVITLIFLLSDSFWNFITLLLIDKNYLILILKWVFR